MAVKFEVLEREKIMMEAANSESVGGFFFFFWNM